MAKKLFRYYTELGSAFDLTSNPVVYIDGIRTEWSTKEVINVTPGEDVDLWGCYITVPSNATKMLQYCTDLQTMGVFLTSDNKLVSKKFGYIVKEIPAYINATLTCTDLDDGGALAL